MKELICLMILCFCTLLMAQNEGYDNQYENQDSVSATRDSVTMTVAPARTENIGTVFFLTYTYEFNTTSRLLAGPTFRITDNARLMLPYAGLTWITKDPFNNRHANLSVSQPAFTALFFILGEMDDFHRDRYFTPMLWPFALFNSTLYFNIYKEPDAALAETGRQAKFHLAPFVKTDTDVFLFRTNKWIQFAPGVGLRAYYGSYDLANGVSFGVQHSYQWNFSGDDKQKDIFFFKLGSEIRF